ncbi:MAG TPA: hypothetical protein VEJ63_15820, partial [Planctomycetota bacterium]|nr:hypothetical protein [Planctomycetota bacterium]
MFRLMKLVNGPGARVQSLSGRVFVLLCVLLFSSALLAGEEPPKPAPPPRVPPAPTDLDEESPRPAPKKEIDLPGGVDWDALRQSFREEERAFILSGNAFVRFQGIKLEADNIVFYRETKEVYAEGNIRLRVGESELAAEVAYIDIPNDVGYLLDAVVRVSAPPSALDALAPKSPQEERDAEREEIRHLSPDKLGVEGNREKDPFGVYVDPRNDPQARANLIFKAGKVVYHSRMHMSAEDAFLTSDDMVHPLYGVGAGKLDFYMKEMPDPANPGKLALKPHKITARRARINVLGFNTFPFPTITHDLTKRNAFYSINGGNSQRWGPFVLARFGYGLQGSENKLFDPTRIYLDLEERYKRGPGGGGEFEWQTGYRPPEAREEDGRGRFERGQGHLRVWTINEFQTQRSDDIIRARREL